MKVHDAGSLSSSDMSTTTSIFRLIVRNDKRGSESKDTQSFKKKKRKYVTSSDTGKARNGEVPQKQFPDHKCKHVESNIELRA